MQSIEALPYLLKELKLPAIKSYWAERAKLAETHHWSYGVDGGIKARKYGAALC